MKFYFLSALMDLVILLVYPIAYIANYMQKLKGTKTGRKKGLNRACWYSQKDFPAFWQEVYKKPWLSFRRHDKLHTCFKEKQI